MPDPRFVLVTGASTGIGAACAHRLARGGWTVLAGVRRDEDGARLRAQTPALVPLQLDVTNETSVAAAARHVEHLTGATGLAGLVNNAGVAVAGPLEFVPIADWRRQLDINVVGQVAVTSALLPALRAARGRIVMMGSIAGRLAVPFLGPYSASKFAIEAISDALRGELRPWGLTVSLIEPGEIATPIWAKGLTEGDVLEARLSDDARARYAEALVVMKKTAAKAGKRGASPETVAAAVEHALTAARPRTRYVVGADARLRRWIARLPDRLRDALLHKAMGLDGRPR